MAYEPKTRPTDEFVLGFLHSVEPARRRTQGLELLDIFRAETGAEPCMWGSSMVGFGRLRYTQRAIPARWAAWGSARARQP